MSDAERNPDADRASEQPRAGRIVLGEHNGIMASVHESDLQYTFSRSSGPGGQAVNKVNTRAQLRVALDAIEGMSEAAQRRLRTAAGQRLTNEGELIISSDRHRSQFDNRRDCLERLSELVGAALIPPKRRRPTKPTRGMIEKRLQKKREQAEKKQRRTKGKFNRSDEH